MTIATRFTADQLVVSTEYASDARSAETAKETITLCKLTAGGRRA